jgi:hypothetical protein
VKPRLGYLTRHLHGDWGDLAFPTVALRVDDYFFPALTFAHRAFCARLIRLRAAADMVFLAPLLGFAGAAPATPVRALMAASRRSRSARSCWTICSIGMAGIVANGVVLAHGGRG